ncbi:alpha/beta fold hydrolase [Salipiger sp. HF18]|uniref:alpha/beta fold hydrolase n=1 Tax=Salipiger sp. HF18 TaxID=2721557 RepID=UPI0020CB0CD7|nr:alpha/beta fold hydrolase [Salipiger sp. HF18]
MARFLLVHGAAHGAWCWRALSAELAALGHEAVAIDLPSHGDDPTPVGEVTLDAYVAAILAALEDETVLVAHSMAGVPATCAADRAPGRVARLVYLCAYLPRDGDSVASLQRRQAERPLRPAVRVAPDRLSFGFDPALAPEIFYHDCSEARIAEALDRMSPQPIAPTEAPVRLEGGTAPFRPPRSARWPPACTSSSGRGDTRPSSRNPGRWRRCWTASRAADPLTH